MFPLYPQLLVANTISAYMVTQVSQVDLCPAPCDKHNLSPYVHPSVTCFHNIHSSLWQTQPLHICSPKCHMFPLHPQPPVTNTTSTYMFTQVSHVSITSPAPCDNHNLCIYVHPRVTCFHYIPSPLWQSQPLHIYSPKCHMLPLHPQIHVTNTTSAYIFTQMSRVSIISQPPVTNTTSAYMFTQVSHVSIISLTRCDKHKLRLYVHPRLACWHPQLHVTNTTSACMFIQLSDVSSTSPAPCDKHNFCIYVHPSVTCFHYIPSSLWQTQFPHICSPNCHMFPLYPQLPVTNTTSACMLIHVSHVSIISQAPSDKHNFHLYAHPSVTCWTPAPCDKHNFRLYARLSVICWSPAACDKHNFHLYTQLPNVCSPNCHMFPLYPQLPVTNTTSACILIHVSHVSIISQAPSDKHNFHLYARLSVTC